MFRNMASSMIRSVAVPEGEPGAPRVPGRIVTTVPKAKELQPFVERLITMARKAARVSAEAAALNTSAERNSAEWKSWRNSPAWNEWNQAIAPALALRRRAFALLRDPVALGVLFDVLGDRFADRDGGYTRVVRLSTRRLGDAGEQAIIEFTGERDRATRRRSTLPVTDAAESSAVAGSSADAVADAE